MALEPKDPTIRVRCGAGLHTSASFDRVHPLECLEGQNFDLDIDSDHFSRRKAITHVATVPNGSPIRGFAQLIKADGTRSVLVQAGSVVYEWDGTTGGSSGFTGVGSVSASARLYGPLQANSSKDNKVYIGDLAGAATLKYWDGTTFANVGHDLGGDLYAKYPVVLNERLILCGVKTSTDTPHVILASEQDSHASFSLSNRPNDTLASTDPFFLNVPDMGVINGAVAALGVLAVSVRDGSVYKLTGTSAKDHGLDILSANARGTGDEAFVFVGNDLLIGKHGAVDTIAGTQKFGDVEVDDLTRWIRPSVAEVKSWRIYYCERLQKIYCFPSVGGNLWVCHKSFIDASLHPGETSRSIAGLSPWSYWKNDEMGSMLSSGPTAAMVLRNPLDGLEYLYAGDSNGYLWQFETGYAKDGTIASQTAYDVYRVSKPFELPAGNFTVKGGYLRARKIFAEDVTLTLQWGGEQVYDRSRTISLAAATNAPVFGGSVYFGGSGYFGLSHGGRNQRVKFDAEGQSSEVRLKLAVDDSDADFFIEEGAIQLEPAK